MIEITSVYVLIGIIGDMARRRGRSPFQFGVLFPSCWFGGEAAGAAIAYALPVARASGEPNILSIYGLALAGSALGAVTAFVIAKSSAPVDGVWRELVAAEHSRLLGALLGGVAGAALGAFGAWLGQGGGELAQINLRAAAMPILASAAVGALLGLVSGVQTKQGSTQVMIRNA